MTTLHDFGGVLGRPLDTFFWALTIHGHSSWLVCEATLMLRVGICVKLGYQLGYVYGYKILDPKVSNPLILVLVFT